MGVEANTTDNQSAGEGETKTDNDQTVPPQGNTDNTDWKAEARKWESRAKSAKADSEDATKWREYEAAQKPIQERLADELAQARAEAANASAELLRFRIAAENGISGDALDLLTGSTQEELQSRAEKLRALLGDQSKTKNLLPDPNQGKPSGNIPNQLTKADLAGMSADEINKARTDGLLNQALGIS
jgi:multidrug efflux pump subunit AcrB